MTTDLVRSLVDNEIITEEIALEFDKEIKNITRTATATQWGYGEMLWYFNRYKIYTQLINEDTGKHYRSFEEYLKNGRLPFGRGWAFRLIRIHQRYMVDLGIAKDKELSALADNITNFDLLDTLLQIFDVDSSRRTLITWLKKAAQAKDAPELRAAVKAALGKELPQPPALVVTPSRHKLRIKADRMPTEEELFKGIPHNAIVEITVRVVGYKEDDNGKSNEGEEEEGDV